MQYDVGIIKFTSNADGS